MIHFLLLTLFVTATPPAKRCSPAWLPISRDPAAAALVVRFGADTVADVANPVFAPRGPAGALRESVAGRRGPAGKRHGQRAQFVSGSGIDGVRPGESLVLVPWEYSMDCQPSPWNQPARWATAGEEAFLTAWLRPREAWIAGAPTFDVEVRGTQPMWRHNDPRWAIPRDSLLTPAEFMRFHELLPAHASVDSAAALRRALATVRERVPHLIAREPARTIVGNMTRYLATLKRE